MSVIGPVQSHYHEGSPVSKRNLRREWFVEKVGCEPGVKEWRSDGWWERGWWQRWVDNWMRRWIEIRLVRLTEWIWKLIPKTRWCISKWAICDFQPGGDYSWNNCPFNRSLRPSQLRYVYCVKAGGVVWSFVLSFCQSFALSVSRITYERVNGRRPNMVDTDKERPSRSH